MNSFRREILQQIEKIEEGRIFTFRNLSYDIAKAANVAVILSELSKKGQLVRIEKGAYYRPRKSKLGLGTLPVYQEEQFFYLTCKLNGYITGPYAYNKMGLTEQVSTTITIATPKPVRAFRFKNLNIECVKAYSMDFTDDRLLPYLRLLDAIKDIKSIPGASEQNIYNRLKSIYFNNYEPEKLEKIISLAKSYPPRVRKVVADILGDMGQIEMQTEMIKTILPTSRFNFNYKTTYSKL